MEALWILPLYFIIPLAGIILLISGIIQYRKFKNKTRIMVGLFLLSLPIIHLFLMENRQGNLEENIVGDYTIEGKNESFLKIRSDGSFEIKNASKPRKALYGKWDVYRGDFTELDLHFKTHQESEVSFEIMEEDNTIKLISSPFNNSGLVLVKK